MKVNSIQNNQQSFGSLKLIENGANCLAADFLNNPRTENLFMRKIVAPLEKAGRDVFYDGQRTFVKNEHDVMSYVVRSIPKDYVTMPMEGYFAYSRMPYRPMDKSKMLYTNDFMNVDNSINFYPDIEAAKNIALNLSAQRSGKAVEAYTEAAKDFKIPDTGNTFEDKVQRLKELFG